jgi:glycosyltransferase involved in cell wall biosynthesis
MYNSEKTIRKTIRSLLAQTYTDFELIIVDNASTDKSVEIVKSFQDPRISLVEYHTHLPHAELNWDRCFYHAKGEYMAIFHADDIYLPGMIKRQVETFQNSLGVVGVFTSGNIINDDDIEVDNVAGLPYREQYENPQKIVGEFRLPTEIISGNPYTYSELLNAFLLYTDFLPTPSAMLKREVYTKCSPFRYDEFKSASDLDMWLRASTFGTLVILDEKLFNYRVSKNQWSNKLNKLRTRESDYFRVMDHHLGKNPVSETTKTSYELSRFGDQFLCQINFLRQYGRYLHLGLLYEKIKLFNYFRRFRK